MGEKLIFTCGNEKRKYPQDYETLFYSFADRDKKNTAQSKWCKWQRIKRKCKKKIK